MWMAQVSFGEQMSKRNHFMIMPFNLAFNWQAPRHSNLITNG